MKRAEKKYLFLVDDGWRYERRELLYYLKDSFSFDIATHDESTYQKLGKDFKVIRLHPSSLRRKAAYLFLMFFSSELDTRIVQTLRTIRYHVSPWFKKPFFWIRSLSGKLGFRRWSYSRSLEWLYRHSRMYTDLLADYSAIIFLPVNALDKRIIFEAKQCGLQLICYVYSWDNPMKDNEFITDADHYLVWNEDSRQALRALHGIPLKKIQIVGPAQFDYLLENRSRGDKRSFSPYVLFACSLGVFDFHIDQEIKLILLIREFLDEIKPSVRLLVRPYPFAGKEHPYEALTSRPGIDIAEFGSFSEWKLEITRKDLDEKYDQMQNAECFINVGSTMALEVALTGTPILQLDFNLPNDYASWQDIRRILDNDHLRMFVLDPSYPNVVQSEQNLREALQVILNGKKNGYRAYSDKLRRFADPLGVSSYKEVFLDALLRI